MPLPCPRASRGPSLPKPALWRFQGALGSSSPKTMPQSGEPNVRQAFQHMPFPPLHVMDPPFPSSEPSPPPLTDGLASRGSPSLGTGIAMCAWDSCGERSAHQLPRGPRERCSLSRPPSDMAAAPGSLLLRLLCHGLVSVHLGFCPLRKALSLHPPLPGPSALSVMSQPLPVQRQATGWKRGASQCCPGLQRPAWSPGPFPVAGDSPHTPGIWPPRDI